MCCFMNESEIFPDKNDPIHHKYAQGYKNTELMTLHYCLPATIKLTYANIKGRLGLNRTVHSPSESL